MSDIYIAEYDRLARDGDGNTIPAPQEPAIAVQKVTNPSASSQVTLNSKTRYVLVTNSGVYHYRVGDNPTATTSHLRVSDGQALFFGIKPADKLAVINGT